MTTCPVCGAPLDMLEAHIVKATIFPEDADTDVPVHPACCPADGFCDSPFEHPEIPT